MMMKNKINFIATYFNELFSNATSELKYHKDYELLISIVLSAQATDKMVNRLPLNYLINILTQNL